MWGRLFWWLNDFMMSRLLRSGLFLCALCATIIIADPAVAGPPYFADDPVPTDTGHWEIYNFASGTKTAGQFDGVGGIDLNYGPVRDVQLTATLPVNYTSVDRPHFGVGDVEVGLKYRFYNNELAGVAIAIFPRLILPTANRRFGSGKVGVLLPVWAQKDIGAWSLFGGGGYSINPGEGNRNFGQANLAITRTLSPRLSLGGEIAYRGADTVDGQSYTALNFGGIYKLNGPFSILFSGGPGLINVRDGGRYNVYVGLGLNF